MRPVIEQAAKFRRPQPCRCGGRPIWRESPSPAGHVWRLDCDTCGTASESPWSLSPLCAWLHWERTYPRTPAGIPGGPLYQARVGLDGYAFVVGLALCLHRQYRDHYRGIRLSKWTSLDEATRMCRFHNTMVLDSQDATC